MQRLYGPLRYKKGHFQFRSWHMGDFLSFLFDCMAIYKENQRLCNILSYI